MIIQAVTLVGSLLVLLAYYLLQVKGYKPTSTAYLAINLAGGLLLVTVSIATLQIGFILLNAVWSIVTVKTWINEEGRHG